MTRVYAGNEWVLKSGSEEAFVDVWREFPSWGRSVVGGAGKTQLFRDQADSRRFFSVGGLGIGRRARRCARSTGVR